MTKLNNKTVFITAAAQGIGRASALALAAAGARVIATDINTAKLAELDGLPNITTRQLNVLSDEDVRSGIAESGRIDVLFNCAGIVHSGTILEVSDADIDLALDLNFKAQVRTIRAVLPQMLERGEGAIISMSTVASSVKAVPNRFAYSASKAAVIGLTKSVAADYVDKGIRINAICPGTVESPSLHERWHATGDFDAARTSFTARQPIGRLAQPEEIAELVVYLANATYTTGQIHVIDGGWTA